MRHRVCLHVRAAIPQSLRDAVTAYLNANRAVMRLTDWELKVSARGVEIGPRGGAPLVTLELSPLAPAATGRPGVTAPAPSPAPALAKPVPGNAGVPPGTEGQPLPEALRRPGLANR